jgi:hypothetical protein
MRRDNKRSYSTNHEHALKAIAQRKFKDKSSALLAPMSWWMIEATSGAVSAFNTTRSRASLAMNISKLRGLQTHRWKRVTLIF